MDNLTPESLFFFLDLIELRLEGIVLLLGHSLLSCDVLLRHEPAASFQVYTEDESIYYDHLGKELE